MYLIDTNIFLEILLEQEKKEKCKKFLNENIENLCISDFSLHSIGVILFRNNKEEVFKNFVDDIIPNIEIVTLPKNSYKDLPKVKKMLGLDFDDAYQYKTAEQHSLRIVTMDKDFEKVKDKITVIFL
ncbi:MAG: type II toxin-antitoxin system VapC family toxin [Candidatus Baldrarchaeia archaeon]